MLNRRGFLVTGAAALSARSLPRLAQAPATRRVVTLAYDKAAGAMRLVERVVTRPR